ncbi:hypothetical protein ACIF85_03320 [Streptomyces sp. NPDC086033]
MDQLPVTIRPSTAGLAAHPADVRRESAETARRTADRYRNASDAVP